MSTNSTSEFAPDKADLSDVSGQLGHVPPHVQQLLNQALSHCSSDKPRQVLKRPLNRSDDVLSKGDTDIGLTDLVEHATPTLPQAQPMKRAPKRLGVQKDKEVERQVPHLVKKVMVTPADSAWCSSVAIVKKKYGSWRLCINYHQLNKVA